MADAQVEFGGQRMGEEAAPTEGRSLAPRPVRARANDDTAWMPATPIVPPNAHEGPVTTRVSMDEACRGRGGMR